MSYGVGMEFSEIRKRGDQLVASMTDDEVTVLTAYMSLRRSSRSEIDQMTVESLVSMWESMAIPTYPVGSPKGGQPKEPEHYAPKTPLRQQFIDWFISRPPQPRPDFQFDGPDAEVIPFSPRSTDEASD